MLKFAMWLCPVFMSHCITFCFGSVGALWAMCAYQQHARERTACLDACCMMCVQHAQRHVYVTSHPSRDCEKMHSTEKHWMNCNCLPAIVCTYSLSHHKTKCSKRVMMSVYKFTQMQHCWRGWWMDRSFPAYRRTGKPEWNMKWQKTCVFNALSVVVHLAK